MTQITMTPKDAEASLARLKVCTERAARLETLKLMLQMGVFLDAGRSVQEIMGRQV